MRGRILCVLFAMSAWVGCGDDRLEGGAGTGGGGTSGSSAHPGAIPMFPGAGNSTDAQPLPLGMVCDSVPGAPPPMVETGTRCFFGPDDRLHPAATIEQVLECVEGTTTVHLRLTFTPTFVDNTYGANAIGWERDGAMMGMMGMMGKGGHTFKDLVGSDHAELVLIDGNGDAAMQFKMDYISEDPDAPSGYSALGVTGGEGEVAIGNADDIVDASTSFDRNLNERGYASYTTDSPATDADYTPNVDAPGWDYRVVYDVWVDVAAFGDAGFAGAFIEYVHASPSKAENNTIETTPDDCPPEWDPCLDENPDTYCNDPCAGPTPPAYCSEPPTDDPCADNMPDTYCADGSQPNTPEPPYCVRYPSDPSCMPE